MFAELQSTIDRIWHVPEKAKPSGLWAVLRARVLSFGVILGLAFLLMVSLVFGAVLSAMGRWWSGVLGPWEWVAQALNLGVGFLLTSAIFAMIYKLIPRARVQWQDVWVGAVVTAMLFTVGKLLIGIYLGASGVASAYGAAGSLVVVLIWVYYSAQIFLLGAEFTWVYANTHGSRVGNKNNRSALTAPESGQEDGGTKTPTLVAVASETGIDISPASQSFTSPAVASDEASTLRPYSSTGHATIKQRAIVYAGSLAALMALRLLLKQKARSRRPR